MRSYVKWVYFSTHWNHKKQRRHLRNGNLIEQRHEDRTQLLRTFYPRPFTHFPWGAWFFLQPSASSDQKGWVIVWLFIKGPQETSLPRTPPATYVHTPTSKAACYKRLTVVDCLADPTRITCWARENQQTKVPHQFTFLVPSPQVMSSADPGNQTGKRSMHLVQRKQ